MAAPTIVVILALGIFPLLYSLVLSFQRRDLQHPNEDQFVGLANYAAALVDPRVLSAMTNTLLLVVVGIAIQFVLGLGLALVVVDELRGKRIIIPLLMLPVMMVPVVVALGWRLLWDSQYGPINQILSIILRRDVDFLWLTQQMARAIRHPGYGRLAVDTVYVPDLAGRLVESQSGALRGGGARRGRVVGALREITLPGLARSSRWQSSFAGSMPSRSSTKSSCSPRGTGTSTETISWYIYQVGFKFFRHGLCLRGFVSGADYLDRGSDNST